jgi:hypothetical protein
MTKAKSIDLTQQELREIFKYDENTGLLLWKNPLGCKMKAGDVAGSVDSYGYLAIRYNKRRYRAHRLIWVYLHGNIPNDKMVDHIDMDKSNNKADNLRLCTCSENKRNTRKQINNTSGYKGVRWNISRRKWIAYTNVNGKYYQIGYFDAEGDARAAHKNFCTQHFGEFYRCN